MKAAVLIPVVVNGDIVSVATALEALTRSGADAVMVGRGAQGKPWFPGELARFLDRGAAPRTPTLEGQLALTLSLYDEMLAHHGTRIGLRHARKHLGWALDTAAETAGACAESLKSARGFVLTAEEPAEVKRRLARAYDGFAWRAAA